MPKSTDRPKTEVLEDGTKIVYMIYREDLAEALVTFEEKGDGGLQNSGS